MRVHVIYHGCHLSIYILHTCLSFETGSSLDSTDLFTSSLQFLPERPLTLLSAGVHLDIFFGRQSSCTHCRAENDPCYILLSKVASTETHLDVRGLNFARDTGCIYLGSLGVLQSLQTYFKLGQGGFISQHLQFIIY
jgi:hypothetical protein